MLEQLPRKPIEEFVIAIAGPIVSLLLALSAMVLALASRQFGLVQFTEIFTIAVIVNFMLCFFNLIPSFPMDGGRIFRAFMTPRVGRLRATYLAAKTGRFMAVAFGLLAVFVIRPFSASLLLIAVFIYYAAGAEYRGIVMQERLKQGGLFGVPSNPETAGDSDHEFSVGPAPYARTKKPGEPNMFRRWFDDLFLDYDS
jgi:stage IV sporulation protein FB